MNNLKVCGSCTGWMALADGEEWRIALFYGIYLPFAAGFCKTQEELGKGVMTAKAYTCDKWDDTPRPRPKQYGASLLGKENPDE